MTNDIDLLLMTETWLRADDAVIRATLKSANYDLNDTPRPSGRLGGGVGIIYKRGMKCKALLHGAYKTFEYGSYEVAYQNKTINAHVIYRPPYSAVNRTTIDMFFDEFQTYLSSVVQSCNLLLITGDFNIHMDIMDDSDKRKMCDLLNMFDLRQHVTVPTHKSGHILDLMITRCSNELVLSIPTVDHMISDHMIVCSDLNLPKPSMKVRTLTYRNLNTIDKTAFTSELKDISIDLQQIDDINHLAASYNVKMRQLLDKHAPVRSKTVVDRPMLPWYDADLKILKADRRRAEKAWRRDNNNDTLCTFHQARNIYTVTLKEKRKAFLVHSISEAKTDPKKLFSIINVLCDKKHDCVYPDYGSIPDLVNDFGNYFMDKIATIRREIEVMGQPIITQREGTGVTLNAFKRLSDDDVLKLIVTSKSTTCALDPLPSMLIKKYVLVFLPILTYIINRCLASGQFPDEWKTALVVPLIKKSGLNLTLNNYRPVSNLPYLS